MKKEENSIIKTGKEVFKTQVNTKMKTQLTKVRSLALK
jgi:hypothetical protein